MRRGLASQPVGEPSAAEAQQPGISRPRLAQTSEQILDVTQPLQMRHAYYLAPLRLADRDDRLGPLIHQPENHHINLMSCPRGRVVNGPGPHPDRNPPKCLLRSEVARPVPAHLLEVRPEH